MPSLVLPNGREEGQISFGRRLLPNAIDDRARDDPNGVYCSYWNDIITDVSETRITWRMFSRAIDKAAWYLRVQLGNPEGKFPTIAYLGPSDPVYMILFVGAIKAGYVLFTPSPRNSREALDHLFEATKCTTLFAGPRIPGVDELVRQRGLKRIEVPDLLYFLSAKGSKPFPYNATFESAKDDPVVFSQTSGSTGLPRPIRHTNSSIASIDAQNSIANVGKLEGLVKNLGAPTKILCGVPLYHIAGLVLSLFLPGYNGASILLLPSHAPVNLKLLDEALDKLTIDVAFLLPSVLEDISQDDSVLPKANKLRCLAYVGNAVSPGVVEKCSRHTKVLNSLGSTESMLIPINYMNMDDPTYFFVNPALRGLEMRRHTNDLHELILMRDSETDKLHATWSIFPDAREHRTKDLFSPHPSIAHFWKYEARADDVLALSNGQSVVPKPIEEVIRSAPEVSDVLVFGHPRFEILMLIELTHEAMRFSKAENLSILQPYLDHANTLAPARAKISKDRILFTSIGKPMSRAGKGHVNRFLTIRAYEREIEALHAQQSRPASRPPVAPLTNGVNKSSTSVRTSIRTSSREVESPTFETPLPNGVHQSSTLNIVQELIGQLSHGKSIGLDSDLLSSGFDNLQVARLKRRLKEHFSTPGSDVSPEMITTKLIYSHSTPRKLARALDVASPDRRESRAIVNLSALGNMPQMQDLLNKYVAQLPQKPHRRITGTTALLTGSTGSLGTYLLRSLLARSDVERIFCLNRSPSAMAKQVAAFCRAGLPLDWSDRVTFLHADLAQPNLGVSASTYAKLLGKTSVIIHNAWAVDFKSPLEDFTSQIASVANIITLAAAGRHKPPVIFMSSVSTTAHWRDCPPLNRVKVPEKSIGDFRVPENMGYAESKFVAERLLDAAGELCDVSSAVCRVGQIAGPVQHGLGQWQQDEWFPCLIKSSSYLGMLPSSLGSFHTDNIDWVPVDLLADSVVELAAHYHRGTSNRQSSPSALDPSDDVPEDEAYTEYNHLVNPHSTSWSAILPVIFNKLNAHRLSNSPRRTLFHDPSAQNGGMTSKNPLSPTGRPQTLVSTPTHNPIKVVPLSEWVAALRASAADDQDTSSLPPSPSDPQSHFHITDTKVPHTSANPHPSSNPHPNPALKILDFFEELARSEAPLSPSSSPEEDDDDADADMGVNVDIEADHAIARTGAGVGAGAVDSQPKRLDTKRTLRRSRTLRALKPVGEEWVERWMQQWGF